MKKMILGIVWQVLGFLGAIIILCIAAHHSWDYKGITGILGSLLGMQLLFPLVICVVMFIAGNVLAFLNFFDKPNR